MSRQKFEINVVTGHRAYITVAPPRAADVCRSCVAPARSYTYIYTRGCSASVPGIIIATTICPVYERPRRRRVYVARTRTSACGRAILTWRPPRDSFVLCIYICARRLPLPVYMRARVVYISLTLYYHRRAVFALPFIYGGSLYKGYTRG